MWLYTNQIQCAASATVLVKVKLYWCWLPVASPPCTSVHHWCNWSCACGESNYQFRKLSRVGCWRIHSQPPMSRSAWLVSLLTKWPSDTNCSFRSQMPWCLSFVWAVSLLIAGDFWQWMPFSPWLARDVQSIRVLFHLGNDYRGIMTMWYVANVAIFNTMQCIMPAQLHCKNSCILEKIGF